MLGVLPYVEDPDLLVSAARATSGTLSSDGSCLVIRVKEVEIAKEVIRSDGW